ncbi:hypothetical protein AB0H92_22135 [Streptomyces phaeochromogenes]|uniref:hypothetical protein n=1 Tax=Streptomyces phaeochromogenes TaxID=1923 RepID=UPI0033DCDC95
MAEQWPTGRFGHAESVERRPLRPLSERPPERRPISPWSPEEQARHRAALLEGLGRWQDKSEAAENKRQYNVQHTSQTTALRRSLRLVQGQSSETGAEAA